MVTNESNVSILKNFIFKIAEQAYTSNDTFNSVKAGIVEEHLNGKYKVKLDGSDTLVEATLFYSNEQINQNDYVYLIEAFTENNSNFIKYFIFGKVSDVNTEIGKSDWSRFIEAGRSGTKSSEWTWGRICTTPLTYDSSEDHKSFIDSINNNGYFAIYGDFTCANASENLKEYGLNITLTYEDDSPFGYKFSSQDFIGQPFNISPAIKQKKIFKIAKNIKSISIKGFLDGDSATISLSNLTIVAGSLYMLDPNIEVKIAAAAGTREYFVGAEQEQIELQANITQNGQSIFSNLINYIWYINDPTKPDTDEGYWTCLNGEPVNEILTDAFGNSITIPVIRGKAANLILYRGTEPIISTNEEDKYLIIDFNTNNNFNRKIKCEIAYEGTSIESNIFDLWDYNNETYDVRIDSNIKPVTFYAGDDIDNPIELTAVRLGGPEKNGPKHDFKFKWSLVEGEIYKVKEHDDKTVSEEKIEDFLIEEKTFALWLSQGEYEKKSNFIDKYVIRGAVELKCELFADDQFSPIAEEEQIVNIVSESEVRVETHYQYYKYPSHLIEGGLRKYVAEDYFEEKYNNAIQYVNGTPISKHFEEGLLNYENKITITIKKIEGFGHDGSVQEVPEVKWDSLATYNLSAVDPSDKQYKYYAFTGLVPSEMSKIRVYYIIEGFLNPVKKAKANYSKWNGVTFEKANREFNIEENKKVSDPVWYGEWNIKDKNFSMADWCEDDKLGGVKWRCANELITESTTEFKYDYTYQNGYVNELALQHLTKLTLFAQEALYYTSRRVWIEIAEDGRESVGRQEEWAYPQILKADKGDGNELVQAALDKLNVFNSLTAGGRDQGMFFEDVYILTKDTEVQDKKYYKKQYNETDGSFTYNKQYNVSGNPKEQFLYELKEDQVYINAEYIQTGALRVGDPEQGHILYADIDQQEVEIGGFTVDKDTLKSNDYIYYSNLEISIFDKDGANKEKLSYLFSSNDLTIIFECSLLNEGYLDLSPLNYEYVEWGDGNISFGSDTKLHTYSTDKIIEKCIIHGVTSIPQYAFYMAGGPLAKSKAIIFGKNINSIGRGAFNDIGLQGDIIILNSMCLMEPYAFTDNSPSCRVFCYGDQISPIGPEGETVYYVDNQEDNLIFHKDSKFVDILVNHNWTHSISFPGFAFSSDENKNMIDSQYFKVSHDGKIMAEEADIAGIINAKGGYIGSFEITETGLESPYVQLKEKYTLFPSSTYFGLGPLNNEHVKIFVDEEEKNTYILTDSSTNFYIQNGTGGAGILFKQGEDEHASKLYFTCQSASLSGSQITLNYSLQSTSTIGSAVADFYGYIYFDEERFVPPSPPFEGYYEYYRHYIMFKTELTLETGENLSHIFSIPSYNDLTGTIYNSQFQYFCALKGYANYSSAEQEIINNLKNTLYSKVNGEKSGSEIKYPNPTSAIYNLIDNFDAARKEYKIVIGTIYSDDSSCYSLGNFIPDNTECFLGTSEKPWKICHARNFDKNSDKRIKNNIEYNLDKYENFYNSLKPSSFSFIDTDSVSFGLIAQEVENNINVNINNNNNNKSFSLLHAPQKQEKHYALDYTEFIALNIDQIQKLKKRESELENKVALLEQEIKEIKGEL